MMIFKRYEEKTTVAGLQLGVVLSETASFTTHGLFGGGMEENNKLRSPH